MTIQQLEYILAVDQFRHFARAAEERCRIALEEGTRKGIEKGIKEGIKEGRKEEQYNIARQMKNDGVPVNSIIKYTGLAIEEIEQL